MTYEDRLGVQSGVCCKTGRIHNGHKTPLGLVFAGSPWNSHACKFKYKTALTYWRAELVSSGGALSITILRVYQKSLERCGSFWAGRAPQSQPCSTALSNPDPMHRALAKFITSIDWVLTKHCNSGINFLWGIGVELAEVPSFIRNRDVCQWHSEFTVGEIHQLKPAVLQRCRAKGSSVTVMTNAAVPLTTKSQKSIEMWVTSKPEPHGLLTAAIILLLMFKFGSIKYFCSQIITKNQHKQIHWAQHQIFWHGVYLHTA